ncbi:putative ARS binding protein Abp2 [Aspergillus affinis]|uniref:putative ARS binding protein Abp2 n=1 Tax=Aspergillus affinis TaxID=1070780 RepID=UPI0022FE490F|nr:putative ARS binding protein Abp2 [Aspergillus affinis]KAI9038361.1 putative ARS binding protein Abp2 [Aspergillus affinis]
MEGPFPNVMNQPDRNELGNPPMVIQQYARYPPTLEPGLQSASSLGSARSRLPASKSPPLNRKATPRSLQASPTGVRSAPPPVTAAQPGPSMTPPMFDPLRQRQPRESMDQPDSRALPSRDIKDDTIDDAYVMFIFHCNPNVPLSVDTSELRKTFRSPPRSDGKSFSIFTLWELIRKLDNKELKTWISLATELGVEPPVMEKGQSTQKVQQYAVRLKRWMRAMHVDAFFEYCLGHPHPYYNQIPTNNSVVSDSRDGVPLEEDLALRALVPQWKPKRGRKRADERDITFERVTKRPSLDTSIGLIHAGPFPGHSATFPPSAIPFSAFPDEIETHDPWMATPSTFPTAGPPDSSTIHHGPDPRWKPIERDASPAGYPQSAIIPRHHHPSEVYLHSTEPRSAVTPSSGDKPRPKRRHGPAVSSAWPSNNGSSTGKTRGRPPNRGTVSGPFSSFPVNPNRSDPTQVHQPTSRPSPAILLDHDSSHRFSQSQYQQSPTPFPGPRPNKLQLQVPHHSGAPVRLATPPTLMLNGINNPSGSLKIEGSQRNGAAAPTHEMHSAIAPHPQIPVARNGHSQADLVSDDAVRVLAGELLRAKVTGRPAPLNAEEARNLALSVVTTLTASYSHAPLGSPVLMSVLHLGLGPHFGYPGVMESAMIVHVELAPIAPANMPGASGPGGAPPNFVYSISHEYKHGLHFTTKVTYGDFTIGKNDGSKRESISRITDDPDNSIADLDSLTDAEFEVDGADSNASEITWKQRYIKMRAQLQKRERSLSMYKRKILESVMADI